AANVVAMESPRPDPPPVISATRPCSASSFSTESCPPRGGGVRRGHGRRDVALPRSTVVVPAGVRADGFLYQLEPEGAPLLHRGDALGEPDRRRRALQEVVEELLHADVPVPLVRVGRGPVRLAVVIHEPRRLPEPPQRQIHLDTLVPR